MFHKAKILKPFLALNAPTSTFTPHYQTFYNQAEPYQPKNYDTQYRSKTTQKWNYNNPNKKSFYGTFTEFPKYIEQGEKMKPASTHQNVWRYFFFYLDTTSTELRKDTVKPWQNLHQCQAKWS